MLSHLFKYGYYFNYIAPPVFHGKSINVYLYSLVAGALLLAICWRFGRQKRLDILSVPSLMVWCASGGVILILLVQICWQQQNIAFKDEKARIRAQWPDENRFFDFILFHAPSGTSCYAVSKTNPRYIRYALYPKLMVSDWFSSPFNCVIVFKMKDPLGYVPAGFGRVFWYDQQSLMAFKEN